MEPKEKIEWLQKTVKQIIEKERGRSNETMDENTPLLLSNMLSQLESLKEDMLKQPQPPIFSEKSASTKEMANYSKEAISNEDIMKELREMKKQNSRTRRLLSIMIGVTVAWLLSEVSAIMIIKEGLTHPLKSIGNMVSGIFKGGRSLNEQELEKDAENKSQVPQIYSLPGLKAPHIPHAN